MECEKILIVDDQIIIAADLQGDLKRVGYPDVEVVTSAVQVMNAVHRFLPDLILMDVSLNDTIDGIDLTKEINRNYDIPIVFITGNSDPETIRRIGDTRHGGLIIKPFHMQELETTIRSALINRPQCEPHRRLQNAFSVADRFEAGTRPLKSQTVQPGAIIGRFDPSERFMAASFTNPR